MKEKPILFSTPMVKAILSGKKTQTRRVIKPQPDKDDPCIGYTTIEGFQTAPDLYEEIWAQTEEGESVQLKPRYEKGDILWVRETFTDTNQGGYIYKADPMFDGCGPGDISWKWKSPRYMPRKAARIFLKVKSIRIEQLQEMSNMDARSEGVNPYHYGVGGESYIKPFAELWNSLNSKRGFSWESNPYVWVIKFELSRITE